MGDLHEGSGHLDALELTATALRYAHAVGEWQLAEDTSALEALGPDRVCRMHARGLLPPQWREALLRRFQDSRNYRDAMAEATSQVPAGQSAVGCDEMTAWRKDEVLWGVVAPILQSALLVSRQAVRRAVATRGRAVRAGGGNTIPIVQADGTVMGEASIPATVGGRAKPGEYPLELEIAPLAAPWAEWQQKLGAGQAVLRAEVGGGAVDFPLTVAPLVQSGRLWASTVLDIGRGGPDDQIDTTRLSVVIL